MNAVAAGATWIANLLVGSIGVSICILAVAAVGASILAGYTDKRRAGSVLLGCFIVLAADDIAGALSRSDRGEGGSVSVFASTDPPPPPSAPLQGYDPYAGASVPQVSQ